jgi:hypothetical protein
VASAKETAAALVRRYGSLDAIVAARDLEPAVARRLKESREYLEAARRVIPPVATIPLPDVSLALPHQPADPDRLAALTDEHGLASPIDRLRAALAAQSA